MSLRFTILGLISGQSQTGYDIYKNLQQGVLFAWGNSHSQVYRELSKLEDEKLVTYVVEHQEQAPSKKIYTITNKGKSVLLSWILENEVKERKVKDEMLLKLSGIHLLKPEEAKAFFQSIYDREESELKKLEKEWKDELDQRLFIESPLSKEFSRRLAQMYIDWCTWAEEQIED